MITDWFIKRALDWRTYAVIALLSVIGWIAHKIDEHGYNRGISHNQTVIDGLNKTIRDGREIYAQSLKDSSNQTLAWQAQTDKANEVANNAKIKLETIIADNRNLLARLRVTTSKADQRIKLPTTPKDAVIDYNGTLTAVFNDCTAKYADLAEIASKQSIDIKQMTDSWVGGD